ncbi:gliding motility protein GldM [bacterium]|nr:gliding motility protein GldM [bacterium]
MAGGKETPRQKMIGMMYLVLTALLALNVSAEVLQAFQNITVGIEETIDVTKGKNAEIYSQLLSKANNMEGDENAEKVVERAKKAQEVCSSFYSYLEEMKKEVVTKDCDQSYDEGPESYKALGALQDPKNIDVSTTLLAEGPNSRGEELKNKINNTRSELVNLFDGLEGVDAAYKKALDDKLTLKAIDNTEAKEVPKRKWEYATFFQIPRGAAVALLTKIQNDVKNAEAEVLTQMFSQLSAGKLEIDELVPVIKATKSAVAVGEKYEAKIFLSAKIGAIDPIITVDGKQVKVENATGMFEDVPGAQGSISRKVMISIKNPKTGKMDEYPAEMNYDVFKAPAIISADKMNVVYQGLDNPISISVPGFEPDRIIATMTPGNLGDLVKEGPGKYIAKIKQRGTKGVDINVSVKLPDGSTKTMGSQNFRTLKVPSPIASLNGNQGPDISTGALSAVKIVSVQLENFVFEGIRYKVSKFDYIWKPARGTLLRASERGQEIPNQLRAAFSNAKRGDLLIISGIYATAPSLGEVPLAGSLVFTVQ